MRDGAWKSSSCSPGVMKSILTVENAAPSEIAWMRETSTRESGFKRLIAENDG